jgi:co-chaperonin GroES (HSP10)
MLTRPNKVEFLYDGLDEAFPKVDPGLEPFGSLVLVQVRQPKRKTAGGIIIADDTRATEHYRTQVAKVVSMGPLAFHSRDTMTLWPEGAWCSVGDFVRVPVYQGERFAVPFEVKTFEEDEKGRKHPKTDKEECVFVLFKDLAILGRITADPLKIRAFLDGN